MKQFHTKTRFHSLKFQLLLIFLVSATLPSLIIGSISAGILYKNGVKTNLNYAHKTDEIIRITINSFTKQCLSLADTVSTDNEVQKNLRAPLPDALKTRYRNELEISQLLYFYHHSVLNEVFGIYILGENGLQCTSNSMPYKDDLLNQSNFYKETFHSDTPLWRPNGISHVTAIEDKKFYSVSMPIKDKATGNKIGIVVIEFDNSYFSSIQTSNYDINDYIFFIKSGQNISHTSSAEFNTAKLLKENIFLRGDIMQFRSPELGSYVYNETDLDSGYQLISLVSLNTIKRECRLLVWFIMIICVLLTLVSAGTYTYFNFRIFAPLEALKSAIGQVQTGDYEIQLPNCTQNEIGVLINGFNKMLTTIQTQINCIYEDQQKLRKAELAVLQEQSNPHFLYNTLDSIVWLARSEDYHSVITMTSALVSFLRIGLSNGLKAITVAQEFEHVENYLQIQKVRYGEQLNYFIDCPTEASMYYIPKLILQPLAENSIQHGMHTSHSIGTISIICTIEENTVYLEIKDTGVGIAPARLAEINSMKYKSMTGGFGIKSLNKRLQLYFDNHYEFWITSNEGHGTEVHIRIPKETEVRDD